MAKAIGLIVAVVVGGLLAVVVAYAAVATQRPDAKPENTSQPQDVLDAGGDPARAVLVYGSR
ncbi:MAG TPA: hypothetical protein VFM37_16420 [Pseudonocardiaceae bacterium]|nr:hypothetical protein [Pseudonocardiaceae bacterium]